MLRAKLRKMEEEYLRRTLPITFFTVQEAEQARLLSDIKTRTYFEPFLAREMTVSAAAKEVGCSLHAMLYRVRILIEAGLLRITRTAARAGRPIKHYRSVHDAYFIPLELTPYAELEERLRVQFAPSAELLTQAWSHLLREIGQHGRRLYRDSAGFIFSDSGEQRQHFLDYAQLDFPAAFDFFLELHLPQNEAKRLQLELLELYKRYLPYREKNRDKAYIFQAALVPKAPS